MPKKEIELRAIDTLARLKEGDVVKRILQGFAPAKVVIERDEPFELPTIMGCTLMIKRSDDRKPLIFEDTRTLHSPKNDLHWLSIGGVTYSDVDVLELAERFGNLQTLYIPVM